MLYSQMQRAAFDFLFVLVTREGKRLSLEFMFFYARRVEGFRSGSPGGLAAAFPPFVPLDKIATLGKLFPIWFAVAITRDCDELPTIVYEDLLENIDMRHKASVLSTVTPT